MTIIYDKCIRQVKLALGVSVCLSIMTVIYYTSHASIAYREQLPPQRTVGTFGSVWQESTPSKETTGSAQTDTQSETMKTNSRKWQTAHARPLLEPTGFSQLVPVLDL